MLPHSTLHCTLSHGIKSDTTEKLLSNAYSVKDFEDGVHIVASSLQPVGKLCPASRTAAVVTALTHPFFAAILFAIHISVEASTARHLRKQLHLG